MLRGLGDMKLQNLALGFAFLFCLTEAYAGDLAWPSFFDPTQKETQAEVLRSWKQKTVPYDHNGKIVRSCGEFLQANGGAISSDAISPQAQAVFDSCSWLSLLAKAKPPQQMLFSHDDIAKEMAEHLDLASIPWEFQQKGSPSELARKHQAKVETGNAEMTLRAKAQDFGAERNLGYSIQFLASADFDGSGRESVVALFSIREDLHMSSGNSSILQEGTALLTRSEPNGPIVAKPFMVIAP